MLAHLTDEKRKHSRILWVNLQEELVLEANGQIFTPREPSRLDQHIAIPTSDPLIIEVKRKLLLGGGGGSNLSRFDCKYNLHKMLGGKK